MESRLANGYGCSKPVPVVMPKPRFSVACAIAETSSNGSFTGICAPCRIAASSVPA